MRRRSKISPEQMLAIARAVVLGRKLDDIAIAGNVTQKTATTYRQRIQAAIEAKGLPMPECGCGRPIGHYGPCSDRATNTRVPFTDEQLEALLAHRDNGARPAPAPEPPVAEEEPEPEESSEAKFARQIGRSVGWGESEASIRKRLGISRLDLEHAKREHVEAYNAGVEEGRVRLVRAQNAQEEPARATPAEPAPRAEKPQRPKPDPKPAPAPANHYVDAGRRPIALNRETTSSFAASDEVEKQEVVDRLSYATSQERRVVELLAKAWTEFLALDDPGPGDVGGFQEAVHRAEAVVGLRIARRLDPDLWRQA